VGFKETVIIVSSFSEYGSVVDAGPTVAVLDMVPVRSDGIVAMAVKVTIPPAGRATLVAAILPLAGPALQAAPLEGVQVQVTLEKLLAKVS